MCFASSQLCIYQLKAADLLASLATDVTAVTGR
jgi:hypothetical protein